MTEVLSDRTRGAVEALLQESVLGAEQIAGGGNNLVLKISTSSGTFLAKVYFTHREDPRERLQTEFGMLEFLWSRGMTCIPRPIACRKEEQVAIYELVCGTALQPDDVTESDVEQLSAFLGDMWSFGRSEDIAKFSNASDSAFSISGHIDAVRRRLEYVQEIIHEKDAPTEIIDFVENQLRPIWGRVCAFVESEISQVDFSIDESLDKADWVLSPADHGFHNALRRQDGRLAFIDFEYAGWDDPAQMIINACHQPAVPIPKAFIKKFIQGLIIRMNKDQSFIDRMRVMFPLLGMKWCLIMMNEFLPVAGARRRFSGRDPAQYEAGQITAAQRKLETVASAMNNESLFRALNAA